jgi:hypothetical protein
MKGLPGVNFDRWHRGPTKKPARRLAFSCPKAEEELLLRGGGSRSSGGSGSRSGSSSSGRSSGGSGGRSGGGSGSRSSSGSGGRSGSSGGSRSGGSGSGSGRIGGLRRFDLRSFNLRSFDLRSFFLAAGGNSQGEEGGDEERLLHVYDFLNVMELLGQLVDRNVAITINF